ncbi:hypothetical protein EVAR_11770_1 [Eumeta japonica]|uniref:Uncharacterized protein n=1 Tax=Eumeta variegata TaxID=151549 RepID=A0A4C1UQ19_EUMVA|nr:hypothetical protein EVAR_11770_1 [Eumeta japonica]
MLGTAATSQVQNALVRPPRRLPDAEVSDAARYHAARRRGATRTSWEQLFLVNRCFGASSIGKTTQTRAGARRRGHRLADACVAEPCLPRPRQPPLRNPVPPPAAERNVTRPRVARSTGLKMEDRSKKEEGRRRVIGKRRRGEGRGSLTRTALAAAVHAWIA